MPFWPWPETSRPLQLFRLRAHNTLISLKYFETWRLLFYWHI